MNRKLNSSSQLLSSAISDHLFQAQTHLNGSADDRTYALHEARKHIKRARALLRLARDLDTPGGRELDQVVAGLGRELAPYRDQDAMREALQRLEKLNADSRLVNHARSLLSTRSTASPEDTREFSEIAHKVGEALGTTSLKVRYLLAPVNRTLLAKAAAISILRLEKIRRYAKTHTDPETFHTWRKRAKTLLYQSQWLKARNGGINRHEREQLDSLAELLGIHHDLAVMEQLIANRDPNGDAKLTRQLTRLLQRQRHLIEERVLDFGPIR